MSRISRIKYKHPYTLFVDQMCALLLLFSLQRMGFFFFQLNKFSVLSSKQLTSAFLSGVYLDLLVAFVLSLPWIVLRTNGKGNFISMVGDLGIKLILSFTAIVNLQYYIGVERSADFNQIARIINFPDIISWNFSWVLYYVLIVIFISFFQHSKRLYKMRILLLRTMLIIGILALFIRAIEIQKWTEWRAFFDPVQIHAYSQESAAITLNSPYFLSFTYSQKQLPSFTPRSEKETRSHFKQLISTRSYDSTQAKLAEGTNVIFLLIPQLQNQYFQSKNMPFLASLKSSSAVFDRHLSNGSNTRDALMALYSGMPHLVDGPLTEGAYVYNKWFFLKDYLGEKYSGHSLYYAGTKERDELKRYYPALGLEELFTLRDVLDREEESELANKDMLFLNSFKESLNAYSRAFVASYIFNETDMNLTEDRLFNSTDEALKSFFQEANTSAWFRNSLFIITSIVQEKNTNVPQLGPLILYHPYNNLSPYSSHKITQHADLIATLCDLLTCADRPRLYFGSSVFANTKGRAYQSLAEGLWIVSDDLMYYAKQSKGQLYWPDQNGQYLQADSGPELEDLLWQEAQSIRYFTQQGLYYNTLYNYQINDSD